MKVKSYLTPVYVAERQRWAVMDPETGVLKYLTQKQYSKNYGVDNRR